MWVCFKIWYTLEKKISQDYWFKFFRTRGHCEHYFWYTYRWYMRYQDKGFLRFIFSMLLWSWSTSSHVYQKPRNISWKCIFMYLTIVPIFYRRGRTWWLVGDQSRAMLCYYLLFICFYYYYVTRYYYYYGRHTTRNCFGTAYTSLAPRTGINYTHWMYILMYIIFYPRRPRHSIMFRNSSNCNLEHAYIIILFIHQVNCLYMYIYIRCTGWSIDRETLL